MNQETKDKIVDKVIALFHYYPISEIEYTTGCYYVRILFEGVEHIMTIMKDGNTSMKPIFDISGDERISELYENVGEWKKLDIESKQEKMFNKFLETEIEKLKL